MSSIIKICLVYLLSLIWLVGFSGCRAEKIKLILPDTSSLNEKKTKVTLKKNAIVKGVNSKINNDSVYKGKITDQEKSIEIFLKNASSSTWFKDILPVFTLILGISIKELVDNFASRKRTRKIGERWKAELEILARPLEKQIKEIKASVEHHTLHHNDPPKLRSIASLECENFESLDKTELLNYINRYYLKEYKKAVLLAGRINLQISIIKSNSKGLKDRFISSVTEAGKAYDKLNTNFQELVQSLHRYKTAIVNSEGEQALLGDKFKLIDKLYGEQVLPYIQDGKFDYLKLETEYFMPMIEELDRLSVDLRTHEMASYTRKCLDSVAGIKMESVYFITNMNNHIKYFEKDHKGLNKILKELDDKNKKFRIL